MSDSDEKIRGFLKKVTAEEYLSTQEAAFDNILAAAEDEVNAYVSSGSEATPSAGPEGGVDFADRIGLEKGDGPDGPDGSDGPDGLGVGVGANDGLGVGANDGLGNELGGNTDEKNVDEVDEFEESGDVSGAAEFQVAQKEEGDSPKRERRKKRRKGRESP